jgi:hypothetical protein
VLVARVLEQLLNGAPFPRGMRFLMLLILPFAAAAPGRHPRLNRAPPPPARRVGMYVEDDGSAARPVLLMIERTLIYSLYS